MLKPDALPRILNANDLPTGDVVYWHGSGWTRLISEAEIITDHPGAEALGKTEMTARRVVDVYPVEVTIENGVPVPARYRERVRSLGPSVRADLGKQADLEKTHV